MFKDFLLQIKNGLIVYKKKILLAVLLIVILGVLGAGFRSMFQVRGVVTAVDNSQVTVASFFRTQTIDLTGAPVDLAKIKPGERILIQKNIQGQILYVRVHSSEEREHHRDKDHHYKDRDPEKYHNDRPGI
ncbi:Hypothetical protein LUCI_4666 [Lucifera butyrica]|uniref:Uncharacterized protein n=1 Tax=Lucifera butyrica TaxID=1351585 RepID=A0A498R9J2_9FIRM|nr:hypothetical protein [Lucifera butyrica]VBB09376.1 Hypothetical protein LUCI_4666 [Lucifera butyrica]